MTWSSAIWVVVLLQAPVGEGKVDAATSLNAAANSPPLPAFDHEGHGAADDGAKDETVAARRYIANLNVLISDRIVPGIRRGVLASATIKPPALWVEVTDDPSPYHIGSQVDSSGVLHVRLSMGYVTMHDAALDAVALATATHVPEQLRSYLAYQLALARANERRQTTGESRLRAMDFVRFAGLDQKATRNLFAQDSFRRQRDRVEIESLGWVVAYLLVTLDPRLAGASSSPLMHGGRAAAGLAASSGWFPVPPFATALGLAEITPSTSKGAGGQGALCRAATLMEGGVRTLRGTEPWASRVEGEPHLQRRLAAIQADIARMRRDGNCISADTQAYIPNHAVTK